MVLEYSPKKVRMRRRIDNPPVVDSAARISLIANKLASQFRCSRNALRHDPACSASASATGANSILEEAGHGTRSASARGHGEPGNAGAERDGSPSLGTEPGADSR